MSNFLGFERGSTIVVTGAGSGIGSAIAEVAAHEGLNIALWDMSEEGLARSLQVVEQAGAEALTVTADVGDADSVANAWAVTTKRFGPVSCLAGAAGPPSFDGHDFMQGVSTAVNCMRLPTDIWLEQPAPTTRSAIYLASVQGPRYGAGVPWYTVAKSAIDGYMRSVAAMRPGAIRANAVLPDWILTPRTERFVQSVGGVDWDANPMGRIGLASDVANLSLFLLSPAAAYLNGLSIEVDGGSRLRSLGWMRMREISNSG